MDTQNEPKQTIDEIVDNAFSQDVVEQPAPAQEQTEQVETQQEDGSDPVKTPSTDAPAQVDDKGFASHPKWQEREQKLKEAREEAQRFKAESERYSRLLDDPDVYKKFLKLQGYSDRDIRSALEEKGITDPPKAQQISEDKYLALAEKACRRQGWDINRLTQDQSAYIHDSVRLMASVMEEMMPTLVDERLRPLEEMSQQMAHQKMFSQEEQRVKQIAAEEFPNHKWEEVVQPAIAKFLKEMDEKDPKRTIKLTYEDIYYRATRPLLKEMNETRARQEVRNTVKKNAKPLGTGPSSITSGDAQKGMKLNEWLDKAIDAAGVS